jgi:fermentation-respiration switch protein FrsA (DUF1100 family)
MKSPELLTVFSQVGINNMSSVKDYFEKFLYLRLYSDAAYEILKQSFKRYPSRVDYFVKRWRATPAESERRILYRAILEGVPISECIKWGIDHDDFGDWDLSEMGYYYLNSDGSYTPMSWEDYDQWLAKQKEIEVDDPEF